MVAVVRNCEIRCRVERVWNVRLLVQLEMRYVDVYEHELEQ